MDLTSLYSQVENNPSSFSGINSLYQSAKKVNPNIKVKDIQDFFKKVKSPILCISLPSKDSLEEKY